MYWIILQRIRTLRSTCGIGRLGRPAARRSASPTRTIMNLTGVDDALIEEVDLDREYRAGGALSPHAAVLRVVRDCTWCVHLRGRAGAGSRCAHLPACSL